MHPQPSSWSTLHLALIEPSPGDASWLRIMLDEIGVQHQIWYYSLAHHAIEALTRKQFPLDCKLICIADILPDIDSKDVIRRIRMCPDLESTPVAIMSADPYIESEGEMTCKLKKPVQKVELSGLLQRFHLLQPQKKAV